MSKQQMDIAIIGMSGKFPGANSVQEFWNNLCSATASIARIDRELLLQQGFSATEIDHPNYVNASGILSGIEYFDAKFFKISPAEAELLDPQVRLLLECAWETLEDAGYATDKAQNIGVFAGSGGMATSYYSHLVNRHARFEKALASPSHLGNDKDYLSTYLSYRLNLTGPSISIQTACSTSLVAVHQACMSLVNEECAMALAGGVRIAVPHYQGYEYQEGYIFSRSGQIRTFDESADGVVFGSGLGLVLLKPLAQAQADGDAIYAVIKSTAILNDGRDKLSYAASSARGQIACARRAIEKAQLSANDFGYIECHGTGTPMGDPEEVKALTAAFRQDTKRTGYCTLGAVKPNIGHLDAASGIASLIKTAMVVREGLIPPTLHFKKANPRIKFDKSPFLVNSNSVYWTGQGGVRTAGVNSLGVGGTNAFLVLQNNTELVAPPDSESNCVPILPMSAKTKESLLAYARKFREFLLNGLEESTSWTSLCYSLQTGRESMKFRLALVSSNSAEAIQLLDRFIAQPIENEANIYLSWSAISLEKSIEIAVSEAPAELTAETEPTAETERTAETWHQLANAWVGGRSLDWQALYAGHRPQRMHLPTYAFEPQRYWLDLDDAQQKAEHLDREDACATASAWDGLTYLARWETLHTRSQSFDPTQLSQALVVTSGEASSLRQAVRTRLIASKSFFQEVHIGERAEAENADGVQPFCFSQGDTEGLANYVKHLRPINTLIFIAGKAPSNLEEFIQSSQHCELPLLRLIRSLKQEKKLDGQVHTYLVSVDQTRREADAVNTFGGGLAGIAYSLTQGHYAFKVRHVDVDSLDLATTSSAAWTSDSLLRLEASQRGELCRIANQAIYRQVFSPFHRQSLTKSPIREGGRYVILGGSGVVGGIFSRYLIARYRAQVIWIGRSDAKSEAVQARIQALGDLQRNLHYYQADAINPTAMESTVARVVAELGDINGAFFAGQIIDYESHIDTLDFADYEETLATKCFGSWNFFRALAKQSLDFLCYFSSGQAYAFSGAAKLCAYASAISASERVIKKVQAQASFPVGTINWGFWNATVRGLNQSSTSVSTDHLTGLEDLEGYEACEAFLANLLSKQVEQLLCIRLPKALEPLFPRDIQFQVTGVATDIRMPGNPALINPCWPAEASEKMREVYSDTAFDDWLTEGLFLMLQPLLKAVPGSADDATSIARSSGILEKYIPWLDETLNYFRRANWWPADAATSRHNNLLSSWLDTGKTFLAQQEFSAMALLAMDCISATPQILQGKRLATDVIFPSASMEKVKNVYANNILSDTYNLYLAEALFAEISARRNLEPNRQYRILEIGAGTGGTSAIVFKRLASLQDAVEVYTYTDLSKAFFFHAEEKFKPDYPYIECRRLDVGKSIEDQGFDLGSYDFVIATNCLHATPDIRAAVRNAKALLKQDGSFLVNELSRLLAFHHVTSGLLDGWWLATDKHLRIPSCPGLSPLQWQGLLVEEGFYDIQFPAKGVHDIGQQVIAAKSNGICIQLVATQAASVEKAQDKSTATSAPVISAPATSVPMTTTSIVGQRDRRAFVMHAVQELLASCLRMAINELDAEIAFSEVGLDSILAVSFVDSVNRRLDISLNTAVIFEFSSIQSLSEHILQAYGEAVLKQMAAAGVIIQPEAQVPVNLNNMNVANGVAKTIATRQPHESCEIAIIGMSGQFPKANDCDEFWHNLISGVDGVEILPENYLDKRKYTGQEKQPGKTRCQWGGVLRNRDCFDSLFFHISPREAESMNPHQRLILQESWKAIEDAGYNPKSLSGSQTGVFIGAEPSGYFAETFTGYSDAIVASRIAYYLNLRGPAFVVNTGCSSSAVAIHLACENLRAGESELALAGGINACMNERVHLSLSEIDMLSPSGRCATFDSAGDGTVISEGVGLVLLKPLNQALIDCDAIYGTLMASGINQDGASNGITAPNGSAQEQLILDVYRRFGVSADQISYVEAHGTGTKLGDPVEANALTRAFRSATNRKEFCALGSSKSHIGHTAAAAGVIGLIKVLLSIRHNFIPRMLHYSAMNPLLQLTDSPFFINQAGLEWAGSQAPRMAALNSFGHSGTNAHLVIKEHISQDDYPNASLLLNRLQLILLSAKSKDQLRQMARRMLRWIDFNRATHAASENLWLTQIVYTLQVGREPMEWRFGCLVSSVDELVEGLKNYLNEKTSNIFFIERCVRDQSGEVLDLLDDEEVATAIQHWIRDGKSKKLLGVWMQGKAVDWAAMYGHSAVKRIHLPTYPFAAHRHWADKKSNELAANDAARPSVLHPLLHENISDFSAQKYRTRFIGSEFYLSDHRVSSVAVLPAVAYLEMAITAFQHATLTEKDVPLVIQNIVWIKPVRVKDPVEIETHLWPQSADSAAFEIVSGHGKGATQGSDVPFCQGVIGVAQHRPNHPMDLSLLKARICQHPLPVESLYASFDHIGMMFGPAHRGVRNIWIGKDEVLSQLYLPDPVKESAGDFLLHPSILDSALQSSLPLLVDMQHLPNAPKLPYAIDELIFCGQLSVEPWVWVRPSRTNSTQGKLTKFDIDIFNPDGSLCLSILGFTALAPDVLHTNAMDKRDEQKMKTKQISQESFDKAYYETLIDQLVNCEVSIEEAAELG